MKRRNELLNIMEAVAAILVIFIHFKFPEPAGDMVIAVARISVPFFYCVSGYFFYKGDTEQELASIPRKIKRLLLLILMSETVYFLFYLALQVDNNGVTFQALKNVIVLELQNPHYAKPFDRIAVFAPLFNGVFWFVGSLIVVYMCMGLVVKYKQQRAAWIVSLVLLGIGLVLRRVLFYADVHTTFPYERLIPFLPAPFFMIGYTIREKRSWFERIDDKFFGYAFIFGIALSLVEQLFGRHTLYVGTLLSVPAVVTFCGKYGSYVPKTSVGRFFSHVGAGAATYVYMLHMMIGNILNVLVPRLLSVDPQNVVYVWLFPVLVAVWSIVCGEAVCLLKRVLIKKR